VKKTKKVACLPEKQQATTTTVPLIRCCSVFLACPVWSMHLAHKSIYRHIRLCKSVFKNIFLKLHILLLYNINKPINFFKKYKYFKTETCYLKWLFYHLRTNVVLFKRQGCTKAIYFSFWASFPSHALFRPRQGQRGRAQNYFLCVLFADPTESASLCRRCAQLCRRRWLLCQRRSRLRDDWALNSIVVLQGASSLNGFGGSSISPSAHINIFQC